MRKKILIIFLFTSQQFCLEFLSGQSTETLKVREYRSNNERSIIDEFISFLSIPNIASDTFNIQKNAAFIMEMMRRRGIDKVQLLSPVTKTAPPAVYGEVNLPGAKQTIIFYAHYDGQPVNPAQWAKGLEPFTPQLYSGTLQSGQPISFPSSGNYNPEWRIYARATSDDKAGVAAILDAYDAIVKIGLKVNSNIKFFSREKRK